jgi:glutathione S-transferase
MTEELTFYTHPMSRGRIVGSHIGFGMEFGTIEKRPAFEEYWQRLSVRPAFQRANEIDDALTAQQQPQPAG